MMRTNKTAKKRTTNTSLQIGKIMLIASIGLMMSIGAYAQAGDPGNPNGEVDTDTPIDGGVSLLVAAGVAYGAKQWRDVRNKKNDEQNAEL